MKQIPVIDGHEGKTIKKVKVGRPPEKQQEDAFLQVTRFFEATDNEQITIHDLIQCMEENVDEIDLAKCLQLSVHKAKTQQTFYIRI